MNRTLTLRREALADLTTAELGGVVGGRYTSPDGFTCVVRECAESRFTDLPTIVSRISDIVSYGVSCTGCSTP